FTWTNRTAIKLIYVEATSVHIDLVLNPYTFCKQLDFVLVIYFTSTLCTFQVTLLYIWVILIKATHDNRFWKHEFNLLATPRTLKIEMVLTAIDEILIYSEFVNRRRRQKPSLLFLLSAGTLEEERDVILFKLLYFVANDDGYR